MRPRLLALVLLVTLATGCGGSKRSAATVTATTTTRAAAGGSAAPIRVTLTAESHHPKVNARWSYTVRVTDAAGRPVPARIHLQILFAGVPVGQVGVHRVRGGVWRETLGIPGNPPFPPASRGRHLVFQAVVRARGRTVRRDWPIVPR